MSNELQVMTKESWQLIKEQAQEIKKAGLIPAAMTAEQAAIIVLKGRELGVGTMRALEGMYVISGKVAMDAKFIMSLIRERCPQAKITTKRKDARGCVIEATRPGQDPETFQFLEEDAIRAQLLGKGPWKQYPISMYWARCVTLVGRMLFSDILGAAYTPEELGSDEHHEEQPQAPVKEVSPNSGGINERIQKVIETSPSNSSIPNTSTTPSFEEFQAAKRDNPETTKESKQALKPKVKRERVSDKPSVEVQKVEPDYLKVETIDPEFIPEELPAKQYNPGEYLIGFGPDAAMTFEEKGQEGIRKLYDQQTRAMQAKGFSEPQTDAGKKFRKHAEEFLNP